MEEVDVECKPLKCLSELLSWKAVESDWSLSVRDLSSTSNYCYAGADIQCHKLNRKSVKLMKSSVPKTLVCHDMKGGYLDDKYVHGSAYNYQYLFYHWSIIDTFVYFSHHFITIPPLMWINAAHNHGVQILGTIITEHVDGENIWKEIFSDEVVQNEVIDQLIAIQKHYRFDGYLVNIENKINADQLPKLSSFLKYLKSKMKEGILIWYDAVSFVSGKLEWQNELNQHNKPAFEICDGIFLNYNWDSRRLQNSLIHAGVRRHDVYVGIDVFGRGCYGGGGFNTDLALSLIRTFGLSAAIFGCGWTHETQANDFKFFQIENKFWAKLIPYLYVHCPNSVPFKTNFNQGMGVHTKERILWYNLSLQSLPLCLPSCLNEDREKYCIDYSLDDSFSGGTCLLLNCVKDETEIHKLIMCDLSCSEEISLKCSITVKPVTEFHPIQLLLSVENNNKLFSVILDVSKEKHCTFTESDYSCSLNLSDKINLEKTINVSSDLWITNTFCLRFEGTIFEINAKLKSSTMIGHLSFE